jgi:hypothetical protein
MNLTEADRLFVAKVAAEVAEQEAFEALSSVASNAELQGLLELHDRSQRAHAQYLDALLAEQAQLAAIGG